MGSREFDRARLQKCPTERSLSPTRNDTKEGLSSVGAGAAISEGKKIRALAATSATKKTKKISSGTICSRKNLIFPSNLTGRQRNRFDRISFLIVTDLRLKCAFPRSAPSLKSPSPRLLARSLRECFLEWLAARVPPDWLLISPRYSVRRLPAE